jgi:hypothetical protein
MKKIFDLTEDQDLSSWKETHYEMVQAIVLNPDAEIVKTTEEEMGYGGMYELAEDLTNEFEELHKGKVWGENNDSYFDEIESFIENKFK